MGDRLLHGHPGQLVHEEPVTDSRRQTHALLSERLERMADRELVERLAAAETGNGMGATCTVEIDGRRVFAKRLPLTAEELARPYATNNVFELPAFYHYRVGSAGFGAFRELAAHVKTTRWELDGDSSAFPLLYHHRILPFTGETLSLSDAELEQYVEYWQGSEPIRRYMLARRAATRHLVLFVEHVPQVARAWLATNLDRAATIPPT